MTVPSIFSKNDLSEQAYVQLMDVLSKLDGIAIEEKKTCVHVVAGKAAFLGVHPRKSGLRLTIKLDRRLPEAVKSEQASKFRFHNEVDVSPGGFDAAVSGWIEEAYHLSSN